MLFSVLSCHTSKEDIDLSAEKIIEAYLTEKELMSTK